MDFSFLSDPQYDIIGAFWVTIQLTVLSAVGALVWGTVLAGFRVSPIPVLRAFGTAYVTIVRNTPLTVVIAFGAIVLKDTLQIHLSDQSSPTSVVDDNFRYAVAGFIVYTSTFVCEAIRSGINTVSVGQAEAARAIGLTFFQVLRIVILPQAGRAVVAPLASVLIALTKNTTVAASIGVAEAALLMNTMVENESDKLISVFLVFALGFLILTLPVGLLLGWVSKRVSVKR